MGKAHLAIGGMFAACLVAGPVWAAAPKRIWQVDVGMTASDGSEIGSGSVVAGERVPRMTTVEGTAGRVGLTITVHPQEDPNCPNVVVHARHTTLTASGETTTKETNVVVNLCADKSIVFDGAEQGLVGLRMEIALKLL